MLLFVKFTSFLEEEQWLGSSCDLDDEDDSLLSSSLEVLLLFYSLDSLNFGLKLRYFVSIFCWSLWICFIFKGLSAFMLLIVE